MLQVLLRVVKVIHPDAVFDDIVAGFIKDDAGNAATTDAATDVHLVMLTRLRQRF